ncbi:MAG: hypothetical protein A2X35_00175 [Elusimicrobia bacterium GWA2_61_42]|nr:MAG: hypothetical protein A2X35_00175 [Elusimicrobia bacterium GWA2_61_42]OGR74513.1 MAG: hypothetical protein A2X38_07925 [Elusimicrobia bacterium GWC2_61_25]
MDMNVVKFDFLAASDADWEAYFRHKDEILREADPEEPLLPREKRKAVFISSAASPYRQARMFLMFSPGDAAAAGFAFLSVETPRSPTYETNKHFAHLTLSVSKKYRGKGAGRLLLKRVIEEAAALEPAISELLTPVVLESGGRFLAGLGATVALENAENRLNFKDVDWKMAQAWAEEGARRNPATALVTVQTIPREDLEDYSAAYTETSAQAPQGDIEGKFVYTPEMIRFSEQKIIAQGYTPITMFTRESDGKISGLTEMMYLPEAGHKATQMLTGVREQYRGRGLGKLLKASMLLHIRKEFPGVKHVATGNADSNAPMLAINNRLGFKKHLAIKLYKLKLGPKLPEKAGPP